MVGVNAVVEEPFTDAAELIAPVDLDDSDVVLTSGGGSVTAIAIAVLADVPVTPLAAVDARRLEAIDAAIESGAAVHRLEGDLHVDGVRRLITGPIEIQHTAMSTHASVTCGPCRSQPTRRSASPLSCP